MRTKWCCTSVLMAGSSCTSDEATHPVGGARLSLNSPPCAGSWRFAGLRPHRRPTVTRRLSLWACPRRLIPLSTPAHNLAVSPIENLTDRRGWRAPRARSATHGARSWRAGEQAHFGHAGSSRGYVGCAGNPSPRSRRSPVPVSWSLSGNARSSLRAHERRPPPQCVARPNAEWHPRAQPGCVRWLLGSTRRSPAQWLRRAG
jgi:hypothetical protein